MKPEEASVGMRVRVKKAYRKPQLRGAVGTIVQSYGHPDCVALEVRLADGSSQLFWDHELEEVEEPSVRSRARPLFRLRR